MKKLLSSLTLLLVLFFSVYAHAAFHMGKDDLCFLNKDPDLAQFGFWGELGVREGVCQGMAGLSKIYKENVEFRPEHPKNRELNLQSIFDAYNSYRIRPSQKIVITGYKGLNALCRDYRNVFLKQSIDLNRDIAIHDILPIYPQFNLIKDHPTENFAQQISMDLTVRRQRGLLQTGRYPLILVYSHVMLVTSIRKVGLGYEYTYYDSNYKDFKGRRIDYGPNGLPVLGQRMIWDITIDN